MTLLKTNRNKIILLIILSMVIFSGWKMGGERLYERALIGVTNGVLKVVKEDTHILLEKTDGSDVYHFRVYTRVQGRLGNYPQETGGLMEPFVIVLSWQLFLFFVLNTKKAFRLLAVNAAVFVLVQMFFLILLTGYYNSEIQSFLFDMMLDNFYIVALVLVIKDNMLYPVFKRND